MIEIAAMPGKCGLHASALWMTTHAGLSNLVAHALHKVPFVHGEQQAAGVAPFWQLKLRSNA